MWLTLHHPCEVGTMLPALSGNLPMVNSDCRPGGPAQDLTSESRQLSHHVALQSADYNPTK